MPTTHAGCRILAVVALYQQSPEESPAVSSFLRILEDNPDMGGRFSLLAYDNSPHSHEVPAGFPIEYVHDPANAGLAAAYNYALSRAEQTTSEWLLLLDQDTTLTRDFFGELLSSTDALQPQDNVAAIVPKLMAQGIVRSPAEPFIEYMRHQFSRSIKILAQEVGVQRNPVSAYNSGATLRVPILRSIGGFPQEFWLDYLDHAVFHALCARGYRVYVLGAVLQHDLAETDLNGRPIWRFRNVLKAQSSFVKRAGNWSDRLLYRLWLLRTLRRLRADCQDKRIWRETALQAVFFSTAAAPPAAVSATRYTAKGL
jgi:GT2 family glycosyltransferase